MIRKAWGVSFQRDQLPKVLRNAQQAEWRYLRPIIVDLAKSLNKPIALLDIGVGDGRVIQLAHRDKKVWNSIRKYIGIDNASLSMEKSKEVVHSLKLEDRVELINYDAIVLQDLKLTTTLELIICTWFTPGNFYPEGFPFDTFQKDDSSCDIEENSKFTQVFMSAYDILLPGGKLVLGSVYKDNDQTRKKQERNYRSFGWEVTTGPLQSFTATKNRFWSQRFTKERIYKALD